MTERTAEWARTLVERATAHPTGPRPWDVDRLVEAAALLPPDGFVRPVLLAAQALGISDLPAAGLDPAAETAAARLASTAGDVDLLAALAVAAVAGPEAEAVVAGRCRTTLAGSPLALAELDVLLEVDVTSRAVVALCDRWLLDPPLGPLPDRIDRLAAVPGYPELADRVLREADRRVAAVHSGEVPYRADGAFTVAEADVVWRAAQVALLRDEPWVGELLGRLLPGVCVAPTTAKTLPSQAVAIVLAQAVEALPTPEAVAALREARRVVRHAGVQKKIARLLSGAERGLAARPEVAVRLPPGPPTAAQVTTVLRALEAGWALGSTFPHAVWRDELVGHPHLGPTLGRLLWEVVDAERVTVLPADPEAEAPVAGPGVTVRLWHPAAASHDERVAWRERVVALGLNQPLKQVFREHYGPADAAGLTGREVSVKVLLGVGLRRGWAADSLDHVLRRELASFRAELAVHGIYPGADHVSRVERLDVFEQAGIDWLPAPLGEVPAVLLSELLRDVDLLVSTAAVDRDGSGRAGH